MKFLVGLWMFLAIVGAAVAQPRCDANQSFRLFYGNGISTSFSDAALDLVDLKGAIGNRHGGEQIAYAHSYNSSLGAVLDFLESAQQWVGWEASNLLLWLAYPDTAPAAFGELFRSWTVSLATSVSEAEAAQHADVYRAAFQRGEKVVVVAHSQGNLFANEAWRILDLERPALPMQSFGVFGVATPATNVAGRTSPYLTHNLDPILLTFGLPDNETLRFFNAAGEGADLVVGVDIDAVESHRLRTYLSSAFNMRNKLVNGVHVLMASLVDPISACVEPLPSPLPRPTALLSGLRVSNERCGANFLATGSFGIEASSAVSGDGCFAGLVLSETAPYTYSQGGTRNQFFGGTTQGEFVQIENAGPAPRFLLGRAFPGGNALPQSNDIVFNRPLEVDIGARVRAWAGLVAGRACIAYGAPGFPENDPNGVPDASVEVAGGQIVIRRGAERLAAGAFDSLLASASVFGESRGHTDGSPGTAYRVSVVGGVDALTLGYQAFGPNAGFKLSGSIRNDAGFQIGCRSAGWID